MKEKYERCIKKKTEEKREWWETPYVIYAFSNPRVRSRIEALMGTYVVQATNRKFMLMLQNRRREEHDRFVHLRISDREQKEVEREKRLILEGKMPIDEAPEELENHPVIKINRLAKRILDEIRRKDEKKRRPKIIKKFNYDLILGKTEIIHEDLEMASCIKDDEDDRERREQRLQDVDQYMDELEVPDEDYLRIKYEDPLVEELHEAETVDDLYELADEIVGRVETTCGGMLKKKSKA